MADQFLDTSWISMDVLRLLTNDLTVAEYFNSDWDKEFKKEFAVGSTIQVKFPQTFFVIDGPGYVPQGIDRISTTVSLDQWIQVPFEWDDYDAAVKLERSKEELREQYLGPAAEQIAQEYDSRAANWGRHFSSTLVGSLGTDPTSLTTYDLARSRLLQKACLKGKRSLCVSSSMMSALSPVITTLLDPGDEISRMFKDGYIGRLKGFDLYESQSLYTHTTGVWASQVGITVTGANQSGTSLIITGGAGDTILFGDKFAIAAVNFVNPRTRRTVGGTSNSQVFTATQDFTLTGGADTISILPPIYGPGSHYQNVDALPLNNAVLTLWPGTTIANGASATGTVGLALTKYAFAMVGGKLYLPTAVEDRSQKQDPKTGIAVRFVKAWDPVRSMQIHRFDSLLGFGNLYQENGAVAVAGA